MKSLEDLSAAEAIKSLSASAFPARDYRELEPVQQELLFMHLLHHHCRLLDVERSFSALKKRMPDTDLRTYTTQDRILSVDEPKDRLLHERKERFEQDWSYVGHEEYCRIYRHASLSWDSYCACSLTTDSDLYLKTERSGEVHLKSRISSQLLLYRLICLFGMPPSQTTEDYNSWVLYLRFRNKESYLVLIDDEGNVAADFVGEKEGAKEAEKSARGLLNFLVEVQFPLSMEGGIAGTVV